MDISTFINTINEKARIYYVKNRISANWGAFSLVEATLNGLKEMLSNHTDIDYISLLSGQDYPIKQNKIILEYLSENKEKEFMHFDPFPTNELPNGGMDRIEYYYDYDNNFMRKDQYEIEMKSLGIRRNFIENMRPYHGSQWWTLSRQCVEHVLDYIEHNKEIINFYRYTRFSDEQVFQTIIMNSNYAKNVVKNNLRHIDWSSVDLTTLDWIDNPPHPKVLTISNLKSLLKSKHFFARKFDDTIDGKILDELDKFISQ